MSHHTVMIEDVAGTMWYALKPGPADVAKRHRRYSGVGGQR
jgi:hypothetical protein